MDHQKSGKMFKQMAGIELVHVPYKGTSQLLPDLLAGRVPMAIDSLPAHLPHLKTGKVRVLAVASPARTATLPDIPTMSEAGLPGFVVTQWHGLTAPRGTPTAIVSRVEGWLNQEVRTPETKEFLNRNGAEPFPSSGKAMGDMTVVEIKKWGEVVRAVDLKAE